MPSDKSSWQYVTAQERLSLFLRTDTNFQAPNSSVVGQMVGCTCELPQTQGIAGSYSFNRALSQKISHICGCGSQLRDIRSSALHSRDSSVPQILPSSRASRCRLRVCAGQHDWWPLAAVVSTARLVMHGKHTHIYMRSCHISTDDDMHHASDESTKHRIAVMTTLHRCSEPR